MIDSNKRVADNGELIMQHWIVDWPVHYAHTPEKQAEKALQELRLELFHAEQRVLDAQLQADYYRARLTFFEEVAKRGIEPVSDQRKSQQEGSQALRPSPNSSNSGVPNKLTVA